MSCKYIHQSELMYSSFSQSYSKSVDYVDVCWNVFRTDSVTLTPGLTSSSSASLPPAFGAGHFQNRSQSSPSLESDTLKIIPWSSPQSSSAAGAHDELSLRTIPEIMFEKCHWPSFFIQLQLFICHWPVLCICNRRCTCVCVFYLICGCLLSTVYDEIVGRYWHKLNFHFSVFKNIHPVHLWEHSCHSEHSQSVALCMHLRLH